MTRSDSRRTLLFAPLVGVLLSVSSVSGQFAFQQSANASSAGGVSPAWVQVGLPTLSVLLTGGLVYLYHKQRKLDELEYTADVQAEGHRPAEESGVLDLCVSNLGRGTATDLSLRIETEFPDVDDYSGRDIEKTPIKRLEQPNADDVRNEWARSARNYLGPEQYFVRFWTPVPVRWTDEDGEVHRTILGNLADELPDSLDRVRLTVTLDYRDQRGTDGSEQVVDDVLPLEPGADLEFLFSRGMSHDEYEQRKASERVDDPFESLALHRPQLTDEVELGRERESGS